MVLELFIQRTNNSTQYNAIICPYIVSLAFSNAFSIGDLSVDKCVIHTYEGAKSFLYLKQNGNDHEWLRLSFGPSDAINTSTCYNILLNVSERASPHLKQ